MSAFQRYQAIAPLPPGQLDIVGDVHGEFEALCQLVEHLGYDAAGKHPDGCKLVFVGDLCDRGPDSPAVIRMVQNMVSLGHAVCILGNHELNILRGQRKDGNNWFWNETSKGDEKFGVVRNITKAERQPILDFFASLPVIACNTELRIVHAGWHTASAEALAAGSFPSLLQFFNEREQHTSAVMERDRFFQDYVAEQQRWRMHLSDQSQTVPFLTATAYMRELRQMGNPIRVLTSGVEAPDSETFFSGGEWRFVQRVRWWDSYTDPVPVLIGHYWRNPQWVPKSDALARGRDLFAGIAPFAWHGARGNVFCVDYCVGARFLERRGVMARGQTRLAALRWPQRTLMFDSGEQVQTSGFGASVDF